MLARMLSERACSNSPEPESPPSQRSNLAMQLGTPCERQICVAQGFEELPQYCGVMMAGFFGAALVINSIRDALPQRYAVYVPVPMAMAIPFYIGANVAIDICIGAVVKAYWHWTSPTSAELKVSFDESSRQLWIEHGLNFALLVRQISL